MPHSGSDSTYPPVQISRATSYYHGTSWVHHAYALAEKIEVVIAKTCDLIRSDTLAGAHIRLIEDKHREKVRSRVRNILERSRTPLTHGAGGDGLTARGITEILEGWENGLAFQILPAYFVRDSNERHASRLERWHKAKRRQTTGLLGRLGEILASFEVERAGIVAKHSP